MMEALNFLTLDGILADLEATSKDRVLAALAARVALLSGRPEGEILNTILQREQLGSTAVGHGVAIPHGKLAGLTRIVGAFARLHEPLPFESVDEEPVDLVFMLIAPADAGAEHLKSLAQVARTLRDRSVAAKLRATRDPGTQFAVLTGAAAPKAA